jgi:hypothetical protein
MDLLNKKLDDIESQYRDGLMEHSERWGEKPQFVSSGQEAIFNIAFSDIKKEALKEITKVVNELKDLKIETVAEVNIIYEKEIKEYKILFDRYNKLQEKHDILVKGIKGLLNK